MKIFFNTLWDERNPREKLLLICGGSLLALFLIYRVLWAPAAAGREQLQSMLPQMQAQLAHMTQQAAEARTLQTGALSATPSGSALLDGLKASLAQQGLQNAQLASVGHVLQLQIKNAPFSNCVAWLDQARREYKVQVVEAHVSALPGPGDVTLTATLQGIGQ